MWCIAQCIIDIVLGILQYLSAEVDNIAPYPTSVIQIIQHLLFIHETMAMQNGVKVVIPN